MHTSACQANNLCQAFTVARDDAEKIIYIIAIQNVFIISLLSVSFAVRRNIHILTTVTGEIHNFLRGKGLVK